MTPEQITDLIRELAVAQYERDLCVDDIANKDARIAELERESRAYRDQRDDNVYENCALIAKNRRFSAALKVAREAIEDAPHYSACGWMGNAKAPHAGIWVSNLEPVDSDCGCWKREALAAIDANLHRGTGSPLPPVQHLGAARTAPVFSDEKDT